MKTKKERMRETALKIKQRLKLLKDTKDCGEYGVILPKFEGMLRNNNEMNAIMTGGCPKKTNNRKNKSNYRHNTTGGYGKANQYSPHDKRQMDRIDYDKEENEISI